MSIFVNGASVEQTNENEWIMKTENICITYQFNSEDGICISSFQNLAVKPYIEYVKNPYSIIPVKISKKTGEYELVSSSFEKTTYGSGTIVKLTLTVRVNSLAIKLNAVAFPGTSVIRQWFEIENESIARVERPGYVPFTFKLSVSDQRDVYYAEWFNGGKPTHESGGLCRKAFGLTYYEPYKLHLESSMTAEYVPMVLLKRDYGAKDGVMTALDYVGPWSVDVFRPDGYSEEDYIEISYLIDGGERLQIEPQECIELQPVTMAVYSGSRDNLMKTLFDWQYKYLWDYTNSDYYAKSRGISGWVYSARCLTEQFNYRTATLNLQENFCQESGFEMIWDDAGWSALPFFPGDAYGSVFQNNYEGPDFRPSQKYFKKAGLKWLLWFAGKPSIGIMENKDAAWGSFEWRTDDIVFRNSKEESKFKKELKGYIERNPDRSFHTCSLGGRYAHTFDMQRLSNYNYLSDAGAGYNLNYYYSYFEVPDKSGDILASFGGDQISPDGSKIWNGKPVSFKDIKYSDEFSRRRLGMVSYPTLMKENTKSQNRFDNGIYRYLKENGVAGRWSYTFHPVVYGDAEHYYLQRMSRDCKRGCIIIGHCPPGEITVFPAGIIDNENYEISFQNRKDVITFSGKELAKKGICLENAGCGELIYLNLSDHPGVLINETIKPVEKVLVKQENNIGFDGVGIYWTPVSFKGISHYEIFRNNELIAEVATGNYWFDYAPEYDINAKYEVCAVSYGGSKSSKTRAEQTEGEGFSVSALGNHGEKMEEKGWEAEYSYDLKKFENMTFIPPEKCPLADLGGTPNQIGGIEGYFEGPGGARVGRGWQQASADVYCVRKYTVKKGGDYHIAARAVRDWYHLTSGGKVSVCIMLNDKVLLPFSETVKNDIYGVAFSKTVRLKKGDELRFILDRSETKQPLHFDKEAELVSFMPVISMLQTTADNVKNIRVNCDPKEDVNCDCGSIREVDNLSVYEKGKTISYSIDASDRLYAVKLRFTTSQEQLPGENIMDISINGTVLKSDYDISEKTLFRNGLCEEVFWNIIPGKDGKINITLSAKKGEASISGIEIAPVLPDTVRINCGSNEPFVDIMGKVWQADAASDLKTINSDVCVKQATPTLYDQGLYQTAVCGREIVYAIPVSDSFYSLHLKFAELWLSKEDTRPVDIYVNGKLVRENWDAQISAGYKNMAADLRFDAISPVDGKITVRIVSKSQTEAILQAIEVDTEV